MDFYDIAEDIDFDKQIKIYLDWAKNHWENISKHNDEKNFKKWVKEQRIIANKQRTIRKIEGIYRKVDEGDKKFRELLRIMRDGTIKILDLNPLSLLEPSYRIKWEGIDSGHISMEGNVIFYQGKRAGKLKGS